MTEKHIERYDHLMAIIWGAAPDEDPDEVALREMADEGGLAEVYRAGYLAALTDIREHAGGGGDDR
jgi:hypothetical protein